MIIVIIYQEAPVRSVKKILTFEDCVCPAWLSFSLDFGLRRAVHGPEEILRDLVRPGMTALDIGCGPGFFSIPMARMVGEGGRVIAADIQKRMLERLVRNARSAGMEARIVPHLASPADVGVSERVDFILAFWMVHEVPEAHRGYFFGQIAGLMKPESRFLLVEPKIHVPEGSFERTCNTARDAGLSEISRPGIRLSRARLYERAGQ